MALKTGSWICTLVLQLAICCNWILTLGKINWFVAITFHPEGRWTTAKSTAKFKVLKYIQKVPIMILNCCMKIEIERSYFMLKNQAIQLTGLILRSKLKNQTVKLLEMIVSVCWFYMLPICKNKHSWIQSFSDYFRFDTRELLLTCPGEPDPTHMNRLTK